MKSAPALAAALLVLADGPAAACLSTGRGQTPFSRGISIR